jgi:hypothetical protein
MRLATLSLLTLSVFAPAYAQLSMGRIEGTVTDAQGASIPGAKVDVKNIDTNLKVSAETQGNGLYQVPNLPIGNYTVTVEHPGFEKEVFTAILVQGNRTTTVDAQLKVGQVSTSVEVTGTQPTPPWATCSML